MTGLPLFDEVPRERRFDGTTYRPDRDCDRLTGALAKIYEATASGGWFTLPMLAEIGGCSEAAASARLRDLRKPRFGGHTIERECLRYGLWRYRRVPKGA